MATADTRSDEEWIAYIQDEIGLAKQPARDLAEEVGSEDALVEFLADGGVLTDIAGIGRTSAAHIRPWFEKTYPEEDRQRRVDDEAYCTEFTTDHGLDEVDDGEFYFAFVCPRCDATNPLVGDPAEFKNRPFRCETCAWVSALDAEFVSEFREEHYDSD